MPTDYPLIRPSLLLDFANTKTLDPRITYTRASAGTYYDGKTVAKAEENLLAYSQEFDNAYWTKGRVAVTANTTAAPDGTTTAELIVPDTNSGFHRVDRTSVFTSAGKAFYSIYVKASGYDIVGIRETTTTGASYTFNLTTGAVGVQHGASAEPSITSVGNGWYRISMSFTFTGVVGFSFHVLDSSYVSGDLTAYSWAGNGTSGIYAWGAQLEQRSTVTAYTPTTTAPITNYVPVLLSAPNNVARFEHNPVTGESLGLEIEEQRTNLTTYSSDFSNAAWTKTNASITTTSNIAPDGTQTASSLVENTASTTHAIFRAISVSSGTSYSFSVHAKAAERTSVSVGITDSTDFSVVVNLATGTITSTTAGCTSAITSVGNGWYRITITRTVASTSVNPFVGIFNGSANYTGNGFSGIYIWGAQLEAGSFATSYIPTVASQVTRSADSASMTGANFSSWFRADEGTVYAEASVLSVASTTPQNIWSIYTSSTNHIRLWIWEGAPTVNRFLTTNGTTQAEITSSALTANTPFKNASAYKVNDFAASTNGAAVGTDTSGTIPAGLTTLQIGNYTGVQNYMNGAIKKIAYYPRKLTNAELVSLTTI